MRAAWHCILMGLLLWGGVIAAAEPAADFRGIAEFHRTRWTTEQGAPGETWAIAQTPDGWLWLGGAQGLFRFDGIRFEPVPLVAVEPPGSAAVYSLFAEENGDLWLGHLYGGVTLISNGSMRYFGQAEGLPAASTIFGLIRDADGVLWAATSANLMRFDGQRWHRVRSEAGYVDELAASLELDGSGALWVVGLEYLYRRPAHAQRFERTDHKVSNGNTLLARSVDGSLWYEDGNGAYRLPDQVAGAVRPKHANSRRQLSCLFDRDGHLWVPAPRAIGRVRAPKNASQIRYENATITRLEQSNGVDDQVWAMLEDQEGNIWVVTRGSLERFRHTNVRRLQLQGDSGSYALAAGDGGVWIGQYNGGFADGHDGLWRFDGQLTQMAAGRIKGVTAAERDANGTLWFAGEQGVWRREADGRFISLPAFPPEVTGRVVHAMTVDGAGNPWVSFVQAQVYRFSDGRWQRNGGHAALPVERPVSMTRDPKGALWFGYRENQIARVAADGVTMYGEQQGLQLGVISAIHVGHFTAVGGENSVALFDGQRFHSLTAMGEGVTLAGVTGIVEAADGDLWLNGFRGAMRVSRQDLQTALRTGRYIVPVEVFDAADGFPGLAPRMRPLPTVIRDLEGRLWFAGTRGVGALHPNEVRRNAIPPPLHIRGVTSGGTIYPIAAHLGLPVGAQDLEFNYTALSFSQPERIRFRYRLEGYDGAWVDAGSRRQAFYTNLAPGDYRFQVIAANESGLWNETGAAVTLTIPPTFLQTRTFLMLCVLAGGVLIWGLLILRVKQVTLRERSRLEERLGERERIARELHDTLLQSVQGLILSLQVTVDQVDASDKARSTMTAALDRADALLAEGRDRVKDLRTTDTEPQSLKQALLDAAQQMSAGHDARLRIIESGTPCELHPIVREEAARIVIEAMANALRHADAKSIEVELSYGRRTLSIGVKDDGRGMEASVLSDGRAGHYGLTGMNERAKRIRGRLSIWSSLSAGTEVKLSVPAHMAYVRSGWKKSFARMATFLTRAERSRWPRS